MGTERPRHCPSCTIAVLKVELETLFLIHSSTRVISCSAWSLANNSEYHFFFSGRITWPLPSGVLVSIAIANRSPTISRLESNEASGALLDSAEALSRAPNGHMPPTTTNTNATAFCGSAIWIMSPRPGQRPGARDFIICALESGVRVRRMHQKFLRL